MRTPSSAVAALAALALVLSLSACGGDDEETDSATAQTDTGGQQPAAPPPEPLVLPTPSVAPTGSKALPGVPAITENATDFEKEPKIAKGTGDAPDQLVIRDLLVGAGQTVLPTDTVEVRYVGALYSDGKVFDASWQSGPEPATFPLAGVVKGFAGGIVGMKIGGRREIVIPAELGYGQAGSPPVIAPNSVLVFVVDLMGLSRPDTGAPDGVPE